MAADPSLAGAATAAPPSSAGAAGPLAGLLASSTVRLGIAGAVAVVLLGLLALSIGAGPLGLPPVTAGSPASTSLNAPAQYREAHRRPTRARPCIAGAARRGTARRSWPPVARVQRRRMPL